MAGFLIGLGAVLALSFVGAWAAMKLLALVHPRIVKN